MPRPKSKVAASAYDAILQAIFSLEIVSGQLLPEEEMSNRFETSRSSIRDALVALEEDGLVEQKPKTSAQVRLPPHPQDVMTSQEARFYLEALSGLELIRRLGSGEATLERLEKLQSEMERIAKTGSNDYSQKAEFLLKDIEFHLAVPEEAGCLHFQRPLNMLLHIVRLYSITIFLQGENLNRVTGEHKAILDAIRDRNEETFVQKVIEHLDEATVRWLGKKSKIVLPVADRLQMLWRAKEKAEKEKSSVEQNS